MALYIGIMSGTSADGIDVVLADFNKNQPAKIIATAEKPWTYQDKQIINSLCCSGNNEIEKAYSFGNRYAERTATVINELLEHLNIPAHKITAIASHGQTIRHMPDQGYSVQIGNHALLAALTNIDVICDFRSMDLACGGQGAPLVPAFHKEICSSPYANRFIVNIGGIANVTALIPNKPVIGFDTGPGNTLIDYIARNNLEKPFDENGEEASKGKIISTSLNVYLDNPYFQKAPPKSTGRELFNDKFLAQNPRFVSFNVNDKLATLTELTAITIVNGINQLGYLGEIYICGGGAYNSFLCERIKHYADQAGHTFMGSIDKLGIDPNFLEAFAFAWLGYKFTNREAIDMKPITGTKRNSVLGCLYPHP